MAVRSLPGPLLATLLLLGSAQAVTVGASVPGTGVAVGPYDLWLPTQAVEMMVDAAQGWAGQARGMADHVAASTLPDASGVVLVGEGEATVQRAGSGPAPCRADPVMVLEASRKSGGFGPNIVITYGGGSAEGGLLLACLMGHTFNPAPWEIQGTFDGPFSASQTTTTAGWVLQVGAPAANQRSVSLEWWTVRGDRDTFQGVLREYH